MYFGGVEFGMSNIFKFQFDIGLVCALRNAINERINLSMNKKCYSSKKSYNAWNKICAILDRLQDTLEYINRCTLGRCKSKSAFDFYEFINNSYVVIDCIRVIGKIYGKNDEIKTIESSQEIFGDALNAGGNDNLFFNYIRSLCAVHPIETNHQNYQSPHRPPQSYFSSDGHPYNFRNLPTPAHGLQINKSLASLSTDHTYS